MPQVILTHKPRAMLRACHIDPGTICIFAAGIVAMAGSGSLGCNASDSTDGPFTPDPAIFSLAPDVGKIVTEDHVDLDTGETVSVRFPVNQLSMLLADGTDPLVADQIAKELGGTIVGRIPDLDAYQVLLETATVAELDAKALVAQARPEVVSAGYNLLGTIAAAADPQACASAGDNAKLGPTHRCALVAVNYFNLVPIVANARSVTTLSEVRVAILDTGLNSGSQFEKASMKNLNGKTYFVDLDDDNHGTIVAAVIAADDKDGSVAGLALQVLGDKLKLYIGGSELIDGDTVVALAQQAAAKAKVSVINLSLGWRLPRIADMTKTLMFKTISLKWSRFLDRHPTVTLIAAAANASFEMNANNIVPQGLSKPNVLVVAGIRACDPESRWEESAYGGVVAISAPAQGVAVIDSGNPDGPPILLNGNSFAAPMVTSTVAVMKAIQPGLLPEKIRDYLFRNSFPSHNNPIDPMAIGASLDMTGPVVQLLVDQGKGLEWFDRDRNGMGDPSGLIDSRLCSMSNYSVEGFDIRFFDGGEPDEQGGASGFMGNGTSMIQMSGNDELENVQFSASTTLPFKLGTIYLSSDATSVAFSWSLVDGSKMSAGSALPGGATLQFHSCAILDRERTSGSSLPLMVQLEGEVHGSLRMTHVPSGILDDRKVDAYFYATTPVILNLPADAVLAETLETDCLNGALEFE